MSLDVDEALWGAPAVHQSLVQTQLDLSSFSDDNQIQRQNSESELGNSSADDNEEEMDLLGKSSNVSESPSTSASCNTSTDSITPPSSRAHKRNKPAPSFNEKWLKDYLMCPIGDAMQCIVCGMILKSFKTSTIKRHIQRRHKESLKFSEHKRTFLTKKFEDERKEQQKFMAKALLPDQVVSLAPYKLAYTIAKYKMPFNKCEPMVEFAKCADPQSKVFSRMACSRKTITTKAVELHEKVLKSELKKGIEESPFWSLMIDESTDSATQEQMAMYVRFIDPMKRCITTKFLQLEQIKGHPNASNICSSIMGVIESDCFQLPW